jgi:hypothetical protein
MSIRGSGSDSRGPHKEGFLAFWTTLPGILTGVAALIAAIVSLVALLNTSGDKSTTPPASGSTVPQPVSPDATRSTAPKSSGGVFAQGEMTMMTPDDADLDGGHVGTSVSGSDLYLYCSAGECLLNPVGSGLMTRTSGPADKSTCTAALEARHDGALYLSQLEKNAWLCLQTSEAHIAALEPTSVPGVGTAKFVFRYTVWQ